MKHRDQLLLIVSIPIVFLTLGIFYFYFNPNTFAYTPKCYFHSFTGLHCPGCGSQRALHEILHGNIWTGFKHNFLILLAILIIGYKFYIYYVNTIKKQAKKNLLQHNAAPWLILVIVLGFWVLRNLPLGAFQILAP